MRTIMRVAVAVCLTACLSGAGAMAEDINVLMDGFYNGLADVIEAHSDDPDACVSAVDAYYDANQATIDKVREISARYMEEIAPMTEKYASLSEEELKDLDEKMKGRRFQYDSSAGADRYTRAMQSFAMRYPQQGMKIATKAFRLMPGTTME